MASKRHTVGAVIPAAGKGVRMGGDRPKQFMPLGGTAILCRVLAYFEATPLVDAVVLAAAPDLMEETKRLLQGRRFGKLRAIVEGGRERQDSVWNGVSWYSAEPVHYFLIHDAARPFIDDALVTSVLSAAAECGSAVPGMKVSETIKLTDERGFVSATADRTKFWSIQTPQIFRSEVLLDAFARARSDGFYGTDDASLVEHAGGKVRVVPGSGENIKITTAEDYALAEIIQKRRSAVTSSP